MRVERLRARGEELLELADVRRVVGRVVALHEEGPPLLEAPFLDEDVVAAALALPSRVKVGPRRGKLVLRRALAPLLPRHALRGPKRGFTVPVGAWVRDALLPAAREQLASLDARCVLREGAALGVLERHLRGPHDRGGQVFALLALEAWCRSFLDR